MFCFMFFIIFAFDFVVKVNGNVTLNDNDLNKDLNIPENSTTESNACTCGKVNVNGTSSENTTTTSATTPEPKFSINLIDPFFYFIYRLMYGDQRRPDKQAAASVLKHLRSLIGPNVTPGTVTNSYVSSSVKTLPSNENSLEANTRKYKKISTEIQSSSTTLPDQHRPQPGRQQTQYPSLKLPDQKGNQYYPSTWRLQDVQYLSTPGQQIKYVKKSLDQQETQLTPTELIDVNAIDQGMEHTVDPAYYVMDAVSGPSGFVTPIKDDLILAVTSPAPPSTEHPIVKDVKTNMVTKKQGYFTAFIQELCTIIVEKNPRQSKELYDVLERVISKMKHEGQLLDLGKRFETAITSMLRTLTLLEPDVVQSYAAIAVRMIEDKDTALDQDVLSLLHDIDNIYTVQEGEELLNTLVQVDEYPKNDSAFDVAESVVKKLFSPYFRTAGSQTRYFLIQSINRVMEKRNLGYRRRIGDLDDRIFKKSLRNKNDGDSGFEKDARRKYDKKGISTNIFTIFNDKKRNKGIIKELIENVKATETIKKYKTKIVRTTAKSRLKVLMPNVNKILEKPRNFGRRASFEETQHKDNEKSNNLNRNINFDNKKDKMADLDDGISKYKHKTMLNTKIKNIKVSRKDIHSGMDIETDGLYDLTSESESLPKTHQNKMDRHRNAKLYKSFKKCHESAKFRRINLNNKVLRKTKGQKRLSVVIKHKTEPPLGDKIRANDNKRPPKANKRYFYDENRHPSDKRRPYGRKGRPTDTNRRPPGANQLNSMYLTPRYEYNSRRFNENLNLTRRSNSKPISTELSYSNEENDIKFHIQDAIRHPTDLKSKIQQNWLIFDKVQNVRRQMAPVDRISLKEESNYSDDELTIKNNIYKVFNKNN